MKWLSCRAVPVPWIVEGRYWPIVSVLSIMFLAELSTSTLAWYERDAEIMLTISSTGLTLGMTT
ncbi:hypothetical protein D9M68_952000 [compost metagenome]